MEHRLIIDLRNYQPDSKGLRFEDFSDDLELREIYIGCHSDLAFDDVISSLRSNKGNIVTKYTRPSFKDFRIVWDQRKKSIRQ
ncbi:MAG: hypothetical protein DRR42_08930 [Gammaproteobacteria bacterium]|nr:MAG: hypothetical protein DRR42_08930 [Gammaproteobacteria bacterium]